MDPAVGRKSARNSAGGADVDKQHVEMGAMYHGETKVPDMMNLRGPAPLRAQPRSRAQAVSVSAKKLAVAAIYSITNNNDLEGMNKIRMIMR